MTEKRVVLQAKGEVQKVGYRDFVQKVARKLGIAGYVENMRGGSVRIVCEGDAVSIEEFMKAIKVKVKFIDVEDIKIVETGEPTGEFEYFDIKRGDMAEELGERLDVSILYLDATKEELKGEMKTGFCAVKEEVRTVGQKVDGVSSDIKSMHNDMNKRFDTLDEKYGEFGEKMTTLEHNIGDLTWQIKRLVDHVVGEELKEKE